MVSSRVTDCLLGDSDRKKKFFESIEFGRVVESRRRWADLPRKRIPLNLALRFGCDGSVDSSLHF